MKQVHLTTDDLLRVRIGAPLGALGETIMATRAVRRNGLAVFDGWAGSVRRVLPADFGVLADLIHPDDCFVDLITPTRGARTMSEGITALRLASRDELRREIQCAVDKQRELGRGPIPAWAANIPDRDGAALGMVAAAVESFHTVAFDGRWAHIHSFLEVTAERWARTMANEGVEALFAALTPHVRWRAPVLEIHKPRICRDLHLRGRGLVIVPSLFVGPEPILLESSVDPDPPVNLIVPALRNIGDFAAAWGPRAPNDALNALLGRTRAAALQTIADGCTTTELARRLGVSGATASEHASILREAGLIASLRHRNTMRHHLTTLGAALLDGDLDSGVRIA
ncbi:winged helix-turn-helix domain-containing protein [Nocardia crassostreae]|uniref:winged helix-turn-helix domain-containing protein n=1 Tax=Nocardia crassostreae TaxID=53428 RepID=UPI00082C8560|nr:winged helix-turn-helix domain-containing protein [Nocardia crassostreae]